MHQVDRASPVLSMEKKKELMIHDSQLCFNSKRRLVPSMGAARAAVGVCRNGLAGVETRHLSVTPGQERERWATTRPPAVEQRDTAMYVCTHPAIF